MAYEVTEEESNALAVTQSKGGSELIPHTHTDQNHQEHFYQITVKNVSRTNQCYTLFGAKPKISNAPNKEITSTVFSTNALIKPDNSYKFRFSEHYYAICGTLGARMMPNSPIRVTDYLPVDVTDLDKGTEGEVLKLVIDRGIPTLVAASSALLGVPREGFSLITGTDFNYPSNERIFVGIGAELRPSPSEEVITIAGKKEISPIAIFKPEPNHYFNIIPSHIWHVSGLNLLPTTGSILNEGLFTYGEFSTEVDFAISGKEVILEHLRNGKLVETDQTDFNGLALLSPREVKRLRQS